MDTQTIIQASAQIVTITNLKPGDAYKRFDGKSYGADTIEFGVVQDVMHNGTDAAFTAFEFDGYSSEAKLKVYQAGADLAIFAATPAEIQHHIEGVVASAQRRLKDAENATAAAQRVLDTAADVYSKVTASEITNADVVRGEIATS